MQPALFWPIIFPPPPACSEIFPAFYGFGAWFATYAYESFVVERIKRNIIFGYKIFYLIIGPAEKRVEFKEFPALIIFNPIHLISIIRLIGSDP